MKKMISIVLLMGLVLGLLVACNGGGEAPVDPPANDATVETPDPDVDNDEGELPTPPPAADAIVLRLAETNAVDHPTAIANEEFARLVEERTEGRVRIEVFPGGQLGDETAVVQELILGTLDIGRISISPVAEFSPGLNALQLPFLYRDAEQMWAVLNGPIGTDLMAELGSAGLVGLTWYDSGSRNFYTDVLIETIEDFEGVRIRMMDSQLMLGIVYALGGSPVAMPLGEVYGALQTGVINGAENNMVAYEIWSHYEVAPYLLMSGHLRIPEMMIASEAALDRLSPGDREILIAAAYDAQLYQRALWAEREVEALNIVMQNPDVVITELSPEEWQRFSDAMSDLIQEFGEGLEDIIEQIRRT